MSLFKFHLLNSGFVFDTSLFKYLLCLIIHLFSFVSLMKILRIVLDHRLNLIKINLKLI